MSHCPCPVPWLAFGTPFPQMVDQIDLEAEIAAFSNSLPFPLAISLQRGATAEESCVCILFDRELTEAEGDLLLAICADHDPVDDTLDDIEAAVLAEYS